jgi:hypothetical protein
MKNYLWNWNVTKKIGSLGVEQQVHGHFLKVNDHIVIVYCLKSQQMRCVMYHNIQQKLVRKFSTQNWKGLVMYNKDHATTVMS